MTTPARRTPEEILRADARGERGVLWKGLLALVLVLVLAYLRQRWWV
ncbi:hypothetical protein [uncultured Serinicoccus sp.]|nr:hypothetical protein [uncultured Serinicoccus sp.]